MSKLTENETEIVKIHVQATEIPPGRSFVIRLKKLKTFAWQHKMDLDEWGLCEYQNRYWVGCQGKVDGEKVLRVPLLDLIEQKEKEYAEWGDEEVFVIAGRVQPEQPVKWFLLSEPELDEKMQEIEFDRQDLN